MIETDIMDELLFDIADILARKLPAEVNFSQNKLDSVAHKIKLVPLPKGIVEDTIIEEYEV